MHITTHNKMPVGMGHALRACGCWPRPLAFCFAGTWIQLGENVPSIIKRVIRILVIDDPYFILPILVQVKSKNRTEPYSRNQPWPQVLFPKLRSMFIKHHYFQGVFGKKEHSDIRIDFSIL